MPVSLSQAKRLGLVLIASAMNLAGCATPPSQPRAVHPMPIPDAPAHATLTGSLAAASVPALREPVVQYGRYSLVEISPTAGQQNLMQQIVDVSMPPTLVASVGDAVRYVLLRSGFVLCDSPGVRILNTLPLPAADEHLGPLTLETALRILVGPAWKLKVNEVTRRVCFLPVSPLPAAGSPAGFGPSVPSPAQGAMRTASKLADHRP
jgi:conjugative transfer region protein (TIGR03748 family)